MLLKKKLIRKKTLSILSKSEKHHYICTPKKGHVAQLNSALDYGSRGYKFESCHGHE